MIPNKNQYFILRAQQVLTIHTGEFGIRVQKDMLFRILFKFKG